MPFTVSQQCQAESSQELHPGIEAGVQLVSVQQVVVSQVSNGDPKARLPLWLSNCHRNVGGIYQKSEVDIRFVTIINPLNSHDLRQRAT